MSDRRRTLILGLLVVGLFGTACGAPLDNSAADGAAPGPTSIVADNATSFDEAIEQERYERDRLRPEDEGRITAAEDDLSPPPAVPEYQPQDDDNWTYTWTVEYALATFEQAIDASELVFTGTVVDVLPETAWNTEDGTQGRLSEWEGAAASPREWQIVRVSVDDVIKGGASVQADSVKDVTYQVEVPGFHALDGSTVGARLLVGAGEVDVRYRDGTTQRVLLLVPQATYISFVSEGPALRLFSAATGQSWKTLGGSEAVRPQATSLDVAVSMRDLVQRAASPTPVLEDQLGYDIIYGPPDSGSDASDIVP